MKLFMFYVGGDCGNSNVELHDVRFSVGMSVEECHEDLRRQWWGTPQSLHLDCWGQLDQADGHNIFLTTEKIPQDGDKLFFVNLGGYDPAEFAEMHKNVLLVAPDAKAATKKALAQVNNWTLPHKDKVFEVEKAVDVTELMTHYGYSLKLVKASSRRPFLFECGYIPIGKVVDQ